MSYNCMKKYHPAAMYYCPTNNNMEGHANNPRAIDMAYGIKNKKGGNYCNKKISNMGQNHACNPYDIPTMSETAWNNRYTVGVTSSKWPKIDGGGYYKAIGQPPIGGRAAIGTYPNCCPPVFCGNLTGGKIKKKKKNRNTPSHWT